MPPIMDHNEPVLEEDDSNILDESDADDTAPPVRYSITSYGADFDVEGLVRRLKKNDIFVPAFQREYVWNIKEASRFIESLLLGLPVPGVFLAREGETNKLLVIDGQQRLKTLQFFFDGYFNAKEGDSAQKVFKLVDVQSPLAGCTYSTLPPKDRIQLENSIIHATVIKQDSPADDDTSIYHIFERLNSGGRRLAQQEIRTAVYHGELIDLIKELNKKQEWRSIYGRPSPRLKDQELLLRFFAMLEASARYERPMSEFLSKFAAEHRNIPSAKAELWATRFLNTIDVIQKALGSAAFRPERSLNTAVFDSVMVGVATRLNIEQMSSSELASAYQKLLAEESYQLAVSRATADKANVEERLSAAINAFRPQK